MRVDPIHDYDPDTNTATLALPADRQIILVEDGAVRIADAVELNVDEERLQLIADACIHYPTKKILSLSPPPLGELVSEVEQIVRRHIVLLDTQAYTCLACWIVASHFFPVFEAFPVLYIGKLGYSRGGSTTLALTLALSPRPHVLVDPTAAYIMRMVEQAKPTLGIDEVERDQQHLRHILVLVRAGFHKRYRSGRAVGAGKRIVPYNLYCPKAVVDPEGAIENAAALSRGLRIVLARADKKVEIPDPDLFTKKYRDIVDTLYSAYIHYHDKVRQAYEEILANAQELGLTGRSVQAYSPILAIAKLAGKETYETVLSYVKKLDSEKPGIERAVALLSTILDIVENEKVFRTGLDGKPYLDLLEVARRADKQLRQLFGRRVYSTDIENALRNALPPATLVYTIRAGRRIAIFQHCKDEEECRQWLINELRTILGT